MGPVRDDEQADVPGFAYTTIIWATSLYKHGTTGSWPWLILGLGATYYGARGSAALCVNKKHYGLLCTVAGLTAVTCTASMIKQRRLKNAEGILIAGSALTLLRFRKGLTEDLKEQLFPKPQIDIPTDLSTDAKL